MQYRYYTLCLCPEDLSKYVSTKHPKREISAIQLAESKNRPDVDELKSRFHCWLLETHQEEKAAEIKEAEGDKRSALRLYMKAGLVSRAAK